MALKVSREEIATGADFDEAFCRRHVCGECGAPITQAWKDGSYWIRCGKVWDHDGFERLPGAMELWRRGEGGMIESTRGPYDPHKTRNWRRPGTKRTILK